MIDGTEIKGYEFLRESMGLRVHEVPDLNPPVIYLREHHVAFVSANLSDESRRRICERLFLAECGAPLHHAS